ncbi:MAG: hypothetical protein DMF87_19555 [Acidobacteria bacterium]|nr:MAG: hypothetical protein DMF87_19555 [Acidobacteriota bacterium]
MNTSVLLAALLLVATPAFAENAPALPRATVEIPALKTSGQTIRVPAGGDLQKALDDAKPGDRIELQPRATYEGPFHLKAKDGDDWIVITTSGELPKPGRHIQPSHAAAMPKLISAGDFLVSTDPGAHHYRFVGIEFAPKAGSFVTTLIQFGDKETSADAVPHHLIVDRCYVHGDANIRSRTTTSRRRGRTSCSAAAIPPWPASSAKTSRFAATISRSRRRGATSDGRSRICSS